MDGDAVIYWNAPAAPRIIDADPVGNGAIYTDMDGDASPYVDPDASPNWLAGSIADMDANRPNGPRKRDADAYTCAERNPYISANRDGYKYRHPDYGSGTISAHGDGSGITGELHAHGRARRQPGVGGGRSASG